MNTRKVHTNIDEDKNTPARLRARALAEALRIGIITLRGRYQRACHLIFKNRKDGSVLREGERPKLLLPRAALAAHMAALDERRDTQNQLQVHVPLLRAVIAGIQQGDSFQGEGSATLLRTKEALLLVAFHPKYSNFAATAALQVLSHFADFDPNRQPRGGLFFGFAELTATRLYNKIVLTTDLNASEIALLRGRLGIFSKE